MTQSHTSRPRHRIPMVLDKLLTYERRTSTGSYLEGVTGLRAVAALWVLVFHSWGASQGPSVRIPLPFDAHLGMTWLFSNGNLGVDIFFVISGFLLSQPWIQARPAAQTLSEIPKFYGRRLLRIIPAYYVVVFFVLYAFLFGLGAYPSTLHTFISVFMLNGLLDILSIDSYLMRGVFWTLYVEIAFYIILPFIAMAAHKIGWKTAVIAMIVFCIGFRWYLFKQFHATDPYKMRFLHSLPGRLDEFAAGIACAYLFSKPRPVQQQRTAWAEWSFWLGIIVLLVMARVADWRGNMVRKGDLFYIVYPTLAAIGAAFMITGIVQRGKSALRLLANPVMIFLGTISYSLYVWHTVFIDIAVKSGVMEASGKMERLVRMVVLVFPLILLVSYGSYWWVERPFLKIRHHASEIKDAFTTRHAIGLLAGCGVFMVILAALTNWIIHP